MQFSKLLKNRLTGNQKILVDLTNLGQVKKIFPDGLTIDHDDNLFMTMFGGGKIIKYNTK
jgi:sugar lactone lactonase YvrE